MHTRLPNSRKLTFWYFLKYTGMPFNFLTVVTLGFIVGIAISGMTFYNFTLDNLRYFGTLKAMGTNNRKLLRMISLEAAMVGAVGYGIGVGAASAWGGILSGRTQIAFMLPWPLLLVSAVGCARHLRRRGGREHSEGDQTGAGNGFPELRKNMVVDPILATDNECSRKARSRLGALPNVTKTFGTGSTAVRALRGINLEVRAGELMMLVGPSGCGKTTLISVIAGVLSRDGGDCSVLGRDYTRMSADETTDFRGKNIGFVFQAWNLIPALTAAENVAVPLIINGMRPSRRDYSAARKCCAKSALTSA